MRAMSGLPGRPTSAGVNRLVEATMATDLPGGGLCGRSFTCPVVYDMPE